MCSDSVGGYDCVCKSGFFGVHCETGERREGPNTELVGNSCCKKKNINSEEAYMFFLIKFQNNKFNKSVIIWNLSMDPLTVLSKFEICLIVILSSLPPVSPPLHLSPPLLLSLSPSLSLSLCVIVDQTVCMLDKTKGCSQFCKPGYQSYECSCARGWKLEEKERVKCIPAGQWPDTTILYYTIC